MNLPLDILYNDGELVAINKPSGLLVHRSPVDRRETRFALQLLRDQLGQRVYPLHRLDKPTSGVLLFARNEHAAHSYAPLFGGNDTPKIRKRYHAVVRGYAPEQVDVDHALVPDRDKRIHADDQTLTEQTAFTRIQRLATIELPVEIETYPCSRYSLVICEPVTGRRHQLRRHLKHINHPIIGDAKHGRGRHNRYFKDHLQAGRLLLHASQLILPAIASLPQRVITAPLDPCLSFLLRRFGWLNHWQQSLLSESTSEGSQ